MEFFKNSVNYVLSFPPYVMLPIIMLCLALIFRVKVKDALIASITIGIGFIGISTIFQLFIDNLGPALKSLLERTGLHYQVLDVGWTPFATTSWAFKLTPILIVAIMAANMIMLALKLTDTVNIDIWNFWHFIFAGGIVYYTTNNVYLSIIATVLLSIIVVKLADWTAPEIDDYLNLDGICITTLSGVTTYPLAAFGNKLLDKIPGLNKLNINPSNMKDKLGVFGEPIMIGCIMGSAVGIGAGYDLKGILNLAFIFAAVIKILPMMCGILGNALVPISEGMKEFLNKKFPSMGKKYIALDAAIMVGDPAVVVTGILVMPLVLLFAFILPGINFIPLGDLPNTVTAIALITIVVKGNLFRAIILSIPLIIGRLYTASMMAKSLTGFAKTSTSTYSGDITSLYEGGNMIRSWIIKVFEGNKIALILIPFALVTFYMTSKHSKKQKSIIEKMNNEKAA